MKFYMPKHIEDVILGLLVAYVVIDVLLAYMSKSRHPGMLETLKNSMHDENIAAVLVIGLGAGVLAYYLARRARNWLPKGGSEILNISK